MIVSTREPSGMAGSGTVRLSDGEVARFAFGSAVSTLIAQPSGSAAPTFDPNAAMKAWFDCSTVQAEQIDDGKSDVATIAEALTTSCRPEWHAAKLESCRNGNLSPIACGMFVEKADAGLLSEDIKVVLAVRAKKSRTAP